MSYYNLTVDKVSALFVVVCSTDWYFISFSDDCDVTVVKKRQIVLSYTILTLLTKLNSTVISVEVFLTTIYPVQQKTVAQYFITTSYTM